MKHSILLLAFFLIAGHVGFAQQSISGKISDKDGKPLSGVIVSLLRGSDSSEVRKSVADENGNYMIAKNAIGRALLKVEKERFVTQVKEVTTSGSVVNFVLLSIRSLDEVVIVNRKKLIEEKSDRTIFNVENSIVAFGGDALEALKKMPGVQVLQQQIKVAGNSDVSIMVNGRLQHLSGDELIQFLRSIPANNLSKIELITSPGAKYDAAGNAGIINLVTKKNIKDGLSGSVAANYNRNTYNSPSGSLSLQYKTGKFNFYSNDNISQWNWLYTNKASLYYTNQQWEQVVNSEYSNKNARAQIGVDYNLRKNMMLGLVYAKGFGGNDTKDHISSSLYRYTTISDSIIRSEGTMHEVYKGKYTANANYLWKIDTMGKRLDVSMDYFSQQIPKERNFNVKNFNSSPASPADEAENRISENSEITIRSANADLTLPYAAFELSMGGKISFVDKGGDFIYRVKTATGFVNDSSKSNRFQYKEQIQAGYLSAQKSIRKFDFKAGLRVERTLANGLTADVHQDFNKDYTRLFPSASISYKPNEHHNITVSFTRRIERPGYNFLNPFKVYYTGNSYQQGNPALQPAISNGSMLAWFINEKYRFRLRINQVSNYWDRIYFTDTAEGVSIISRANLGNAMIYVFNFSFSENPASWWELNGEISGTYNRFWLNAYASNTAYDGFSGWVELSNTFYINKSRTLFAELNGYYYSPRQKDYKLWKEMYNISGGIKALLLHKTLAIGLAFDDPFASSRWLQINKGNGTVEYSYDDQRSISCSLSYKFGNKNQKVKKEKSETIEEIQRAK